MRDARHAGYSVASVQNTNATTAIQPTSLQCRSLGTSLMYWQGQENQPDDVTQTIKALATQFPKQGKHDAILIMAHGTPQVSNAYYSVIQAKIDELGYKNVFVYTVEGWPSLETVLPNRVVSLMVA